MKKHKELTTYIKHIIDYTEGQLTENDRLEFEMELSRNKDLQQEFELFKQINVYMRGRFDLDEVRNDPLLQEADLHAKDTIAEYYSDPAKYNNQQSFVRDNISFSESGLDVTKEIDQIKSEVDQLETNEISEGWVKEWREKNDNMKSPDPREEMIRSYIMENLEAENKSGVKVVHNRKSSWKNIDVVRLGGLVAAVLIAGIIIIRILLPSGNPEKLYNSYYSPLNAISPVTRDLNSNLSKEFVAAIEMYKQENYQDASAGFSAIMQTDPAFVPARFFEGITQMELANYNQAIYLLSEVITTSVDFRKEAQWYLGLSYLMTGEVVKAIPCFEALSGSEGYYQDRAVRLLRRLK